MSAWRCFEYRLVLWCSSLLGYVNCCSLPSGSHSIASCLRRMRTPANCSPWAPPARQDAIAPLGLFVARACPLGARTDPHHGRGPLHRAQLCCILVDVSLFFVCFNPLGFYHPSVSQLQAKARLSQYFPERSKFAKGALGTQSTCGG